MAINKKGTVLKEHITELLACQYDKEYYKEPDGSIWIRISHHNNPTTYKFASNNIYTINHYIIYDYWTII